MKIYTLIFFLGTERWIHHWNRIKKRRKEFTTEILNWLKHFNLKPYQNWVPNDIDNYVEPSWLESPLNVSLRAFLFSGGYKLRWIIHWYCSFYLHTTCSHTYVEIAKNSVEGSPKMGYLPLFFSLHFFFFFFLIICCGNGDFLWVIQIWRT